MEASITLQKIKENFENDVIEVHSHFQQDTAVLAASSLLPVQGGCGYDYYTVGLPRRMGVDFTYRF